VSAGDEEARPQELVIIRRAPSGEDGAHKGGVWKIAYADFMTAMMAFFLVMWLINSTDEKTLTQVATYFNPLRLTDKVPLTKGLQSDSGGMGKENLPSGSRQQEGEAKPHNKAASGRAKHSEEALFRDPYKVLSELAQEAESERPPAESPRGSAGPAFRDPFDPVFRREAQAEKHERAAVAEETKKQSEKSPQSEQLSPAHGSPGTPETMSAPGPNAPATNQPEPPKPGQEAAKPLRAEELAERARQAAHLEGEVKALVARLPAGAVPNIEVTLTEEGVLISLTDAYDFGMFAIASAEPRPAMVVVMEKLAKIISGLGEKLIVRGHTDGRPYKLGNYDNWRLSSARAHMAYYMLVRGGVDERRFERIEGHADRTLRVATDPNAAQNRRIEILLRKDKP
jgi:chemotaxis protein MotB